MIGYSYSTNHSSTNTLTMSKKKYPPRQLKQRYYYIFWSIATLAVVFGQINVSNAYNRMSTALEQVLLEK